MATQKIKHERLDLQLPAPERVTVVSVSGKLKTLAQIRYEARLLAHIPDNQQSEDDLQHDAYTLLWNKNFRLLCYAWHTPNGGERDPREAQKFKGMGVRAGIPDLVFMTHGARVIFIELKLRHYRREPDQELFERKARDFGFEDCYCCGTLREVAALLCHIFDRDPFSLVLA
jgi:hypothetical protein